jgi:hypothetical protein
VVKLRRASEPMHSGTLHTEFWNPLFDYRSRSMHVVTRCVLSFCLVAASFARTGSVHAGKGYGLEITGGNNQSAAPGAPYAVPLSVRFADTSGNGLANQTISFQVLSTSGATASLTASSVLTDANGAAQTTATAGSIPGAFNVRASVGGERLGDNEVLGTFDSVDFDLTIAGAPQAATALPAFSTTASLLLAGLVTLLVWHRRSRRAQ